ncbi:hypothetical protein U14_03304 [Candidatus Moduliflexus flocculans]|uniref:Uncharacterized protein n=1 Tax=Candidatus Moduliflexus flocculans TaxID=1499966 RepID=A0A081BNU1_9BACT|nr:hypothetical protein U14_03304 [Candidatus Moduliflexus flocculans]
MLIFTDQKSAKSVQSAGYFFRMSKRTLYRIAALLVVFIVAVGLFWIGRGHSFLVDNQKLTIHGTTFQPVNATLNVSVNGQPLVAVKYGQRKKLGDAVAGPWHTITVEVVGKNKAVEKTIEKRFSVPLDEMFLVSLPALLADDPNWLQVFRAPRPTPPPDEK